MYGKLHKSFSIQTLGHNGLLTNVSFFSIINWAHSSNNILGSNDESERK
jgi:hypothetical protein